MSIEQYNDCPPWANIPAQSSSLRAQIGGTRDYGNEPFVVDIEEATERNSNFRTALWTGEHLQLTLMSVDVDDDIGLEMHPDLDQFLRIEEGDGLALMGYAKDNLTLRHRVEEDWAILVPAGVWHNVVNIGRKPLKLYSIYAPPEHPKGTIHVRKSDETV